MLILIGKNTWWLTSQSRNYQQSTSRWYLGHKIFSKCRLRTACLLSWRNPLSLYPGPPFPCIQKSRYRRWYRVWHVYCDWRRRYRNFWQGSRLCHWAILKTIQQYVENAKLVFSTCNTDNIISRCGRDSACKPCTEDGDRKRFELHDAWWVIEGIRAVLVALIYTEISGINAANSVFSWSL